MTKQKNDVFNQEPGMNVWHEMKYLQVPFNGQQVDCGVHPQDGDGLRLVALLGEELDRPTEEALRLPLGPRWHPRPRQELLIRQPNNKLTTGKE